MRKYVKNVIRGIENVRGDTKNVKNVCEKYEKWYKKNIRQNMTNVKRCTKNVRKKKKKKREMI